MKADFNDGIFNPSRTNARDTFFSFYGLMALIMGCLALLFAYGELTGKPVRNKGFMLITSYVLLFLYVVEFCSYLWEDLNPNRRLVRMSDNILVSAWYFVRSLKTLYVATMFGYAFALAHQSWLYRPLLAAAVLTLFACIVLLLPSLKAAASGGGQGLSSIDLK